LLKTKDAVRLALDGLGTVGSIGIHWDKSTTLRWRPRMYSWTPACPLSSKATRVSHGPNKIHEYAFVVVPQIGQVVGEASEVVANAGLQVLGNMTIDRDQRAAAILI
jgi:hypothetical protein